MLLAMSGFVLSIMHIVLSLLSWRADAVFLNIVAPICVVINSWRFVVGQSFWARCFIQVVEVVLEPYDVIR